ncbi:MAG: hypothetical protein Q9216_002064 [Gyalolechia sp. 2 TL-2023]
MATEAIVQTLENDGYNEKSISNIELLNIEIKSALLLPESDEGVESLLTFESVSSGLPETAAFRFVITSVVRIGEEDCFTEHAQGKVRAYLGETDFPTTLEPPISATSENNKTELRGARWYQQCSHRGLNYGSAFQTLGDIHAFGDHNSVSAEIYQNLQPVLEPESRYLIHPTLLDSVLQLSILAPHASALSSLLYGFVPVELDRLTLWPQKIAIGENFQARAQGQMQGARIINADSIARNAQHQSVVEIKGLRLCAIDQAQDVLKNDNEPFTRLFWRPVLDRLTTEQAEVLYPPAKIDLSPKLNNLALYQLIVFAEVCPEIFTSRTALPHLNRFLDWIRSTVDNALARRDSAHHDFWCCSISQRLELIEGLSDRLKQTSIEARIMCNMYQNLPAIFGGEKTGIQVALQDNMLSDLYEKGELLREGNRRLAEVVLLQSHKNPRLTILEVGAGTGSATKEILKSIGGEGKQRGFQEYVYTDITPSFLSQAEKNFAAYKGMQFCTFDMEKSALEQSFNRKFDLIIASNVIHATTNIVATLRNVRSLLNEGGMLVLLEVTEAMPSTGLILGTFSDFWKGQSDPCFPRTEGPFLSKQMWREALPQSGFSGLDFCLDDFSDQPFSSVLVSTATTSPASSVPGLEPYFDTVTIIYRGQQNGFVSECQSFFNDRKIQTSLRALSDCRNGSMDHLVLRVEIDNSLFRSLTEVEWQDIQACLLSAKTILWVTNGGLLSGQRPYFAMAEGLVRGLKSERPQLRISILDLDLNLDDSDSTERQSALETIYRLNLETAVNQNSLPDWQYRQRDGITFVSRLLGDGRLNQSLQGKQDRALRNERIQLADVSARPLEIVKDMSVSSKSLSMQETMTPPLLLQSNELEVQEVASSIERFCLVVHALMSLADIQDNERILIHSADISLCLAVSQVASNLRTEIYFAVETASAKATLLQHTESVLPSHVILSSNPAAARELRNETQNSGVDVILSSAGENSEQDFSSSLAEFGRLVYTHSSRRTSENRVMANINKCRGSVFTVDLANLTHKRPDKTSKLLATVKSLWEKGAIGPIPNVEDKLHEQDHHSTAVESSISKGTRVMRFDDLDTSINVRDRILIKQNQINPDSSYILVGCLGGLGRCVSTWMVARGARSLVYLSRSGEENTTARAFLTGLRGQGVDAKVMRGDVGSLADVEEAVSQCDKPIRGLIQAALTLKDGLFETMSFQDFQTTVKARVEGTLNLHTALKSSPLDFFVTFSSWTSVVGNPTQTNYLASNAFMDAFATYRRSLGMPATSLSLSQIMDVGVVSSTPKYQITLERYGLYGNSPDEFLEFCDTAISDCQIRGSLTDNTSVLGGHLLAGVEPKGLQKLGERVPLTETLWYKDKRFSHLIQDLESLKAEAEDGADLTGGAYHGDVEEADVKQAIHRKVAQLLFASEDEIDVTSPINRYGIDSMVAAELRNWLLATFKFSVTLLTLLAPMTSISSLAELVESAIVK